MSKIVKRIGKALLEVTQGDIVNQDTDAVVNAANKRLAPGGGVAGAIHRAAGPGLWEECKELGGCQTGEAKITSGHRLPNKYVVHTVGPIYGSTPQEERTLRLCYNNSLNLAVENGIRSIAFPAISTGAFGYPVEEAAKVALDEVSKYLEKHQAPSLVRFVLYSKEDFEIHKDCLTKYYDVII